MQHSRSLIAATIISAVSAGLIFMVFLIVSRGGSLVELWPSMFLPAVFALFFIVVVGWPITLLVANRRLPLNFVAGFLLVAAILMSLPVLVDGSFNVKYFNMAVGAFPAGLALLVGLATSWLLPRAGRGRYLIESTLAACLEDSSRGYIN